MKKIQTLAQLVLQTREKTGYSRIGLATRANLDVSVIEDIEAGRELFLSATVRQKLAIALKLSPGKIKSLEKYPLAPVKNFEIADKTEELKLKILKGNLKDLACPECGENLICRVAIMYDLDDNMVRHPKARCSKCPFQIK